MKQTLLLSLLLLIFSVAFAQPNQWTWMSGDNDTFDRNGVYGIKGVASATNKPGGRQGAVSWTDGSGNLWVFGGRGSSASSSGHLNDLWKYTLSTGLWTWISGSSAPYQVGSYGTRGVSGSNNMPGSRTQPVSWTDASSNFWLFGGEGYSASGFGFFNDLWKYSPATNQWAWISGDSTQNQPSVYGVQGTPGADNKPGARSEGAAGQIDAAGNLWLYGGAGNGGNSQATNTIDLLGDLWKYSISSGQWTWVSGDKGIGGGPVYGTKGIAAAANKPGGRQQTVGWTDVSGNFWLFGGQTDQSSNSASKNDLWKYDVSTDLWTWVTGSNTDFQGGVYGTKGVANAGNTPGARFGATAQRDLSGNLLMFGGLGRPSITQSYGSYLNDLWSYSPALQQWTWVSGDTFAPSITVYGSKGVSAASNSPGSRGTLVSWIGPANTFWIFGGLGFLPTATYNGTLNELWGYTLSSANPSGVNSFTAQKESQGVTLIWTSSPDQNVRSFSVERYNGTVTGYQSIGTVPATGTTSSHYSFTDNAPLTGTNFYRIRQVDQVGSATYSATAQVDMNQYTTQFSVYQNPVQNVLQLVIQLPAKQKLTLQVRDLNGHVLIRQEQTGNPGRASFAVPVDRLSKGTYLIQVQSESINSTKTFIKQ